MSLQLASSLLTSSFQLRRQGLSRHVTDYFASTLEDLESESVSTALFNAPGTSDANRYVPATIMLSVSGRISVSIASDPS